MNRGTDHTFSVTQTCLEGDLCRWIVQSSADPIYDVSFMIKQCLPCSPHAQSQCLFVSMLTGAPTCNVSHMELRNEQKDVTISSHVDLHHHPTAKSKGLHLPFHWTRSRALLLQHKIRLCRVWFTTIFVSSCLCLSSTFLCTCFHNTKLLYIYYSSKLLYSFALLLSSCLSSSSSEAYFSFYSSWNCVIHYSALLNLASTSLSLFTPLFQLFQLRKLVTIYLFIDWVSVILNTWFLTSWLGCRYLLMIIFMMKIML